MTTPFYYSTRYTLDKSHFSETFDESTPQNSTPSAYAKAIALACVGFSILYFSDVSPYAAWFLVVLGGVDACSIYFRKSWWLARQMISEAANVELTLTINEEGVTSKSFSVDSKLLWQDLTSIERTKRGWLLHHSAGKNYLSARCLSEQANDYIHALSKTINTGG